METMGTYGWGTNTTVKDWLFEESFRFEFFQAVRLLELMSPGHAPMAETGEPTGEAVRFSSSVVDSFAPTNIAQLYRQTEKSQPKMVVHFLGLAGAFGPLPPPYTEYLLDRAREKDFAMRDFLDVFNHRLISVFYRSRKKLQVGFELKHPEQSGIAEYLYALVGLGLPAFRNRLSVHDRAVLRYAGIVSQNPHSASGLQRIISDYFHLPVFVENFVGQWLRLEYDQKTAVGVVLGKNNELGATAVIGNKVWEQRAKIRIHITPKHYSEFRSFLPVGKDFGELLSLTEFYVGQEHDVEIALSVQRKEIPGARLHYAGVTRLGWNAWLQPKPTTGSAEVRIRPRSLAKIFLTILWHNDPGIDYAMERIPSSMISGISGK